MTDCFTTNEPRERYSHRSTRCEDEHTASLGTCPKIRRCISHSRRIVVKARRRSAKDHIGVLLVSFALVPRLENESLRCHSLANGSVTSRRLGDAMDRVEFRQELLTQTRAKDPDADYRALLMVACRHGIGALRPESR